jgi:hypothetical protein
MLVHQHNVLSSSTWLIGFAFIFVCTSRLTLSEQVASELKKQMADLEQRAKGTSVLNSSRLKEMIPQSKQKQVDASKRRTDAFEELAQLLLVKGAASSNQRT